MNACPKPIKPVRGTKAAKDHMAKVAQLPCVCCQRWPVKVHHCIHGRFSQSRASDFETIPLCAEHHDALHSNKNGWADAWGEDRSFLRAVAAAIYGDVGTVA